MVTFNKQDWQTLERQFGDLNGHCWFSAVDNIGDASGALFASFGFPGLGLFAEILELVAVVVVHHGQIALGRAKVGELLVELFVAAF